MLREIKTNITYFQANKNVKTIAVSSANTHEGKTIFISNLALMLAEAGKKVVLVDADFRSPFVNRIYKIENGKGFAEFLSGAPLEDLVVKSPFENLFILTAGETASNTTSELLSDDKLNVLKTTLLKNFDYILIDTPPLKAISDAAVISTVCDGTVIIVQKERTTEDDLTHVAEALSKVGSKILGVVMTGVKDNERIYHNF